MANVSNKNMASNFLQLIIVDGVDKAGKSTLMSAVSKKIPGIVIKITDRPKDASPQQREKIKDYYRTVYNFIENNPGKVFLLDRYIWSEMAYSFKRGYEATDDPELKQMETELMKLNHLVIFCNPSIDKILERIKRSADDYITEDDVAILKGRYEKIFQESPLNKLELDTAKPIPQLLKLIYDKINEHK